MNIANTSKRKCCAKYRNDKTLDFLYLIKLGELTNCETNVHESDTVDCERGYCNMNLTMTVSGSPDKKSDLLALFSGKRRSSDTSVETSRAHGAVPSEAPV